MKSPTNCQDPERRRLVQNDPTINGIDYLEVLDLDAPTGSPRQRTLLLWFFDPLPLTPDNLNKLNIRIEGGVRVTNINIKWAVRAADAQNLISQNILQNPHDTQAEVDFYLDLPDPENLLLVRTASEGDFSAYTLSLVASPTSDSPPTGFDPLLSCIDFSFKVDCPSEFDCLPEEICPPAEAEEPELNYLARDFATFRQLMLDRMAVIMPDWEERNTADLGITLVESLARAADHLSYYQDAVATESYLGTARLRPSIRRHSRLLDYEMHDGCNARAWIHFTVDEGGDGAVLKKVDNTGKITRLLTKIPVDPIIPEADWEQLRSIFKPAVFELMHDVQLHEAHNRIPFYTWGDQECCLPEGATRATLLDTKPRKLKLEPGDVLVFEEVIGPDTGLAADADPNHRHAVRLTVATPQVDPLTKDRVLTIEWDPEDALPFSLCISAVIEGALTNDLSLARGNIALADHGRTISGEELPGPYGHRRYRPRLRELNVTTNTAYTHGIKAEPAAQTLVQDPRKALPAVSLTRGDEVWTPQRDLLNSSRTAEEFVVEIGNDGTAALRFGDGVFGKEPSFDEDSGSLEATYRIGSGTAGNVGAGSIAHVVTEITGITAVRNPILAQGGAAAETLAEVRQYAPQAFRTQERAVTEADYAEVTERHSEVQKAKATRRWTGSWYTMFITIDRVGGFAVDPTFEDEIRFHLEKYRLAGQDVEIDGPRFVSLDIAITVCVKEGYFQSDVKETLLEVFSSGVRPDGWKGYFHPDHFTFGQPLYLSELISTAMEVTGVRWVDIDPTPPKGNRFKRWGEAPDGEIEDGRIEADRLEILRLDNDPSQPENGKIEFKMEGGN